MDQTDLQFVCLVSSEEAGINFNRAVKWVLVLGRLVTGPADVMEL
jgi:hypothetical protein